MSRNTHQPYLLNSDTPLESLNTIKQIYVSNSIIISIEEWVNEPKRKWIDAGVFTAKKGYKWITIWVLSKNFIVTKILDEKDSIVGTYCDITSAVKKVNDHLEAYDWYLDIFKLPDKIHLLDEDELNNAYKAG